MARPAAGYSIGSSTRRCALSGRELVTGEPFVAVLAQNRESEEFVRLDFAEDSWTEESDEGQRGWRRFIAERAGGAGGAGAESDEPGVAVLDPRKLVLLGFWKGATPEPGARRRLLVDDASLLELFEQSESDLDPAVADGESGSDAAAAENAEQVRLAFRFMLALILLRKKLLISEKTVGRNMWVRPRGSAKPSEGGTLIEVVDPGMDDELATRVTGRLAAVLEGNG